MDDAKRERVHSHPIPERMRARVVRFINQSSACKLPCRCIGGFEDMNLLDLFYSLA
jgi:hypothetical protein